jgi:hypothetical protein
MTLATINRDAMKELDKATRAPPVRHELLQQIGHASEDELPPPANRSRVGG